MKKKTIKELEVEIEKLRKEKEELREWKMYRLAEDKNRAMLQRFSNNKKYACTRCGSTPCQCDLGCEM